MMTKTVLLAVLIVSTAFGQSPKKTQDVTPSRWIDDKIYVTFSRGYLDESGDLILAWEVRNRSGKDIDINFRDIDKSKISLNDMLPGSHLLNEPARVFLKLKYNQTSVRVKPEDGFLRFIDDMVPEALALTFRMRFPISSETKKAKLTWESVVLKHMRNAESIIVYEPRSRVKIVFPMPAIANQ